MLGQLLTAPLKSWLTQGTDPGPTQGLSSTWSAERACNPGFVFQGNSNNIATVDISTGFVGFDSYAEAPAVLLTAFGTFAGPLLWASHLVHFLSSEASR